MQHKPTSTAMGVQPTIDTKATLPANNMNQALCQHPVEERDTPLPDVSTEPASDDPSAIAHWQQVRLRHPALGMCRR